MELEETVTEVGGGAEVEADAGTVAEIAAPSGPDAQGGAGEERCQTPVDGESRDLYDEETRRLQAVLDAQRPVLERLMERYGVAKGDLNGLRAAVEAEDARRAKEAADLAALLEETARRAALERERALVQNILAQGVRPAENGAAAQTGVTARVDPARMTPAQRAEIARRAARGEKITFC